MELREIIVIPSKNGNIHVEIYPKCGEEEYYIRAQLNNVAANVMNANKDDGIKEALLYFGVSILDNTINIRK